MGEVVEPLRGVLKLTLAIIVHQGDRVRCGETFDQRVRDARQQAFVGFDDQIHARQRRCGFGVQQVFLGAFDVAQHQHRLVPISGEVFRLEQGADGDPFGYTVLRRQGRTGFLGFGVEVEGQDLGVGHPPGHAHRVVALGAADVEDDRVIGLDGLFDVGQERLLVAAQQFGDVAAFGRLRQEVHALERALHHRRALLLQQRVLDQHAAPLGEQAQGVVELGGFVAGRLGQQGLQLLADVGVEAHAGKCALAKALISSSLLMLLGNADLFPSRCRKRPHAGMTMR